MYVVLAVVLALVFAAPANAQRPLLVFVLAGQSNMSGSNQAIPAERPIKGVYDVTFATMRPAVDPLGAAGGFGPGRAIGAELERLRPKANIGLVMCAHSGSYLSEWQPDGDLYQPCIEHVRAALAALGGSLAGVFFAQGESDAEDSDLAATWSVRFVAAIESFRTDIGHPDLPVVFSQIGEAPSDGPFTAWPTVQTQQQTVLADAAMITTADIPSDVHYDWGGYQRLGLRYADAWRAVVRRDR